MHGFSLEYIRCVNCNCELKIDIFESSDEIKEGLLICPKCNCNYPVIDKIPILWRNLSQYFFNRPELGGYLMNQAKHTKLKSLVRESLRKVDKNTEDISKIEKRWVTTYKNSIKSKFYFYIKKMIDKMPNSKLVLEHGCSIGYVTKHVAQKHDIVFGIDQSFYALSEAKKNDFKNLDFFVANSLSPPFGKSKFDLIVGLNILELIDPLDFLKIVSEQAKGFVILSDPYDFERGKNSVKKIDPKLLRHQILAHGFKIIHKTSKPSFIPWRLNINSRLSLNYKVDLIVLSSLKA